MTTDMPAVSAATLSASATAFEQQGNYASAISSLRALAAQSADDDENAAVLEKIGDLSRRMNDDTAALAAYQAAFRASRQQASAIRKAALMYIEQGREELAKQLLDLEADLPVHMLGVEAISLYVRIADALLYKPTLHAVAKDAVQKALALTDAVQDAEQLSIDIMRDLTRVRTIGDEIDGFAATWKEQVRRLRDAALDARDKRESAKKYLAIAQIYAAYAPNDAQVEQNVDKCLLLAPGFRPALRFLEAVYRQRNKIGALVDRLQQQAKQTKNTAVAVDLWQMIATLRVEMNRSDPAAIEAYENLLKLDAKNAAAVYAIVELLIDANQASKAAQILEKSVEKIVVEDKNSLFAQEMLRQLIHICRVELNDPARALPHLEALRQLTPDDTTLVAELAEIYQSTDDWQHLAGVYEGAVGRPVAVLLAGDEIAASGHQQHAADMAILQKLLRICDVELKDADRALSAILQMATRSEGSRADALWQDAEERADTNSRRIAFGKALLQASGDKESMTRYRKRAASMLLDAGDVVYAQQAIHTLWDSDVRADSVVALLDALLEKVTDPEARIQALERRLQALHETDDAARILIVLGELADLSIKVKKNDEAIKHLRAILAKDVHSLDAIVKLEGLLRGPEQRSELADVLEMRLAAEKFAAANTSSDTTPSSTDDAAIETATRLARLSEEVERFERAAALYLELRQCKGNDKDILRALEKLLARGVASVSIAEALEPYYASVSAWPRYVEMLVIRRDAASGDTQKIALSRQLAAAYEEKRRQPRDAFDVWCSILLMDPTAQGATVALERLATATGAFARLAEVLEQAADMLPDGPEKHDLLARRASLLAGALGKQEEALAAHRALLDKNPTHVPTLDALAKIYDEREAWDDLIQILQSRLPLSADAELPRLHARLGLLLADKKRDFVAAKEFLSQAVSGPAPVAGVEKTNVLRALAHGYRALLAEQTEGVAETAAKYLGDWAETLAGAERAAVRAELGDVLAIHLSRHDKALSAYEAALANNPSEERALAGLHRLVDTEGTPGVVRRTAGRLLTSRYEAGKNVAARADVLMSLLKHEEERDVRRRHVEALVEIFSEDLDIPEQAVSMLLTHIERDPDDAKARAHLESLATATNSKGEVATLYARLRESLSQRDEKDRQGRELLRLYGTRHAEILVELNDIGGAIASYRTLASVLTGRLELWERVQALYTQIDDHAGVADALSQRAQYAIVASEKVARLVELADHCFDRLKDADQGLAALQQSLSLTPDSPVLLSRLESRLRGLLDGASSERRIKISLEIAEVLKQRGRLAATSAEKAALLLDSGALYAEQLDRPADAVTALTEALRMEREGNSAQRATQLLQRIAERDNPASGAALQAIIEHHRAQKAWQPLVESLEIAANKVSAGDERAQILDEVSRLQEQSLRVPTLAFLAACRALRDKPTDERMQRVRALADATANFAELLAVVEDIAEQMVNTDAASALLLYREVAEIAAKRLDDKDAEIRAAEAILLLSQGDKAALTALERIYRELDNRDKLAQTLERRAATTEDPADRQAALLELGNLSLLRSDDGTAEKALRQLLFETPNHSEALLALDKLYERTGNAAAQVEILRRRIDAENDANARAALRSRLALLKLQRRSDPVGALDDLRDAVEEAPAHNAVRAALEVLVEHALQKGAPSVGSAARLLAKALRTAGDAAALVTTLEQCLSAESERNERAALLGEMAHVYESRLQQPDRAFLTTCRALRESPNDDTLRAQAQRLAVLTDNEEMLAEVYEDLLEAAGSSALRAMLYRYVADVAERVRGNPEEARVRLQAAVQAGADDVDTLLALARLCRTHNKQNNLLDALERLVVAAQKEENDAVLRSSYSEMIDVAESLGDAATAIGAAQAYLHMVPDDKKAKGALERLLGQVGRWDDLVATLESNFNKAPTPQEQVRWRGQIFQIRMERLEQHEAAVVDLESIIQILPTAENIITLGAQGLTALERYKGADAASLRGRIARLLAQRYESLKSWSQLADCLRLLLEAENDAAIRKPLWLRLVDVQERLIEQPEQALLTLGRALADDPRDNNLRDRLERLSSRLRDSETLIGLYEDILETLHDGVLQASYAQRCAELKEASNERTAAASWYERAYQALHTVETGTTGTTASSADTDRFLERLDKLYRLDSQHKNLVSVLLRKADRIVENAQNAYKHAQYTAQQAVLQTVTPAIVAAVEKPAPLVLGDAASVSLEGAAVDVTDEGTAVSLGDDTAIGTASLIAAPAPVLPLAVAFDAENTAHGVAYSAAHDAALAVALPALADLLRPEQISLVRQFWFEAASLQATSLQDDAAAVNTLNLLLSILPEDVQALRALSDACERLQRWTDFADALSREFSVLPDKETVRALQVRYRLGHTAATYLGKIDEACTEFAAVLSSNPQHADTRTYLEQVWSSRLSWRDQAADMLLRAYEVTKDWQRSIQLLQEQSSEAERRGDADVARRSLLRIASIQEKFLSAADLSFATLCRALRLDPADTAVHVQLEDLAKRGETVDELCEVYDEEAAAAETQGRLSLAATLRERSATLWADALESPIKAIEIYEGILEKQPNRLSSLAAVSALYARIGRWDRYERAMRRRLMFIDEPQERFALLLPLADAVSHQLRRYEDALLLLEEAQQIVPDSLPVRRLLIEILDEVEQPVRLRALLEDDIAYLRQAMAIGENPQHLQADLERSRLRLALLLSEEILDVESAIPLWEEIRNANLRDVMASQTLERLYTAAEKWSSLRRLYEEDLERTNDANVMAGITEKLGRLLSDKLDGQEEAILRHQKVLSLDPTHMPSLDALRRLYRTVERFDELSTTLRRMMRLTAQPQALKELRFELAEVLGTHLGRRAETVETGRRVLDIEPHTADELERLANIFRAAEAYEELAVVLERHCRLLRGDAHVAKQMELALLFEERLGRPASAIAPYEAILQENPRHEDAFNRLSALYTQIGDWSKLVALKEERQRRSAGNDRITLLLDIARLQDEKLGQKPMAFLAVCRALREDYQNRDVADLAEKLAVETDSVEEMIVIYDDTLAQIPDESRIIEVHLRMAALARDQLNDVPAAESHYLRILDYDAVNSDAVAGLLSLYERSKRWRDVISILEKQADRKELPQRIEMLHRIAAIFDEKLGEIDSAIGVYRRVLELDNHDTAALRALASIFERAERWQSLIGALRRQEELCEVQADRLVFRYRIAGIWESKLDNPEQAVGVYRSILDEDPAHALSLKALERIFTVHDRPSELLRIFERMLELANETDEKVRLLGKIAGTWEDSFENYEQAVDAYDRLLSLDPENRRAIAELERLLRQMGNWERLVEAVERHMQLTKDAEELVVLSLSLGDVLHHQLGRSDAAEQAYKNAHQTAMASGVSARAPIHALGQLYERSGNWYAALEWLGKEAQLLGPTKDAVEIYYRIGKINEDMLLDVPSSEKAYKAALEIDGSYLPALAALREIAHEQRDDDAYLRWLRAEAQYTQDRSVKANIHTNIGLFLEEKKNDEAGAANELEKALALVPDLVEAALPLSDLYFRTEQWGRTEQLLDIVVDRAGERMELVGGAANLCRYHYRLGYVCEKLGKEAKSLKHYQRATEIDASYLPALEGLGAAFSRAGRWDDAAKIYQAILQYHKDSLTDVEVVDYYYQIAEMSNKLNQLDKAAFHVEKALEIDVNHAPSLRLLSNIFVVQKRFEDAYEIFIRLVPLLVSDERAQLLMQIGEMAKTELDDPYRAIDAYEDASRLSQGNRVVLRALLDLYRQTRQGQRAVEVLEELVRLEQNNVEKVRLLHLLGEIYRDDLKNEVRAEHAFNAALDLDATSLRPFEALETMLIGAKNWAGLETNYILMLQRIAKMQPVPAEQKAIQEVLWKNLAGLYRFKLKNYDAAAQAYMVLVNMKPKDVDTLTALAEMLLRLPEKANESISVLNRLIPLQPERMHEPLHHLLRLYLSRQLVDRAYVVCTTLNAIGDLQPDEGQLLTHYTRLRPTQAKRALTPKAWEQLLTHKDAQGPVAQLCEVLWEALRGLFIRQPRDFGLDKKKIFVEENLDSPVPTYFVSQLRYVRDVLAIGNISLVVKKASADPPMILPLETPTLLIGEGSEMFRDMPSQQLWYLIASQLTLLKPSFSLARVAGVDRLQSFLDAAVRLIEPRYVPRGDAQLFAEAMRLFEQASPELIAALRGPVVELLAQGRPPLARKYMAGIEHTAIRAGHLLALDVEHSAQVLQQSEPLIASVETADRLRELLLFIVSDAHFELRERVGTAVHV